MRWPCQASEHDADHREPDKSGDSARISLEIARQAAIAADPGQGSFDDPALGQDDEFVQFVALDDLDHPMAAHMGVFEVKGQVLGVHRQFSGRCFESKV